MADVINKITKQYIKSVNTPEYDKNEWIINPVLPNCDKKYWEIDGDLVKEMTAIKKQAVDQAEADAQARAEADAKDITKADRRVWALAEVVADLTAKTAQEIEALVAAKLT